MGNSPSTEQAGFQSGPYLTAHAGGSRLSLKSFSTPKTGRARRPSTRDEQSIAQARFLAEEKLSGKSPRLVIRDPLSPQLSGSESAPEELGGLRIRVPSSSARAQAKKGKKGPRVLDAYGAGTEMRMEYKNAASYSQNDLTLEVVTSQPLGRSASLGAIARYSKPYPYSTHSASTSQSEIVPPMPNSRNGSTSSSATVSAVPVISQLPLSPPTIPYRSTSSLGNPSNDLSSLTLPPESPDDDGDVDDRSPWLGLATPGSHWSESSAGGRTPPVPFATFRNSMQFALTASKRHSSGSHRYSSIFGLKGAGPSSPPAETASKLPTVPVKGWVASLKQKRQPSIKKKAITVVNAERMASGRYSMMKEAAEKAAAARKPGPPPPEPESPPSPTLPPVRRGSLAAKLIQDMQETMEEMVGPGARDGHLAGARRRSSGTSGGTARRPSVATSGSRAEVEKLANFVAATPELAFASPDAKLFQHRPSISAMPITTALPAGHPANHHDRFKRFNQQAGPASPTSATPTPTATVGPASGPAPLPRPRGSLSSSSSRRPSTLILANSSPRRSIDDSNRRPSATGRDTPETPVTPRKLSNFRLSIAEPRAGEGDEGERRDSLGGSYVEGPISRKSSTTLGADAMSPVSINAPMPTRLSILSRKMSFPHSVTYESTASPGERRGSYFSMTPTLAPAAISLDGVNKHSAGVIGWGAYTVNTGPPTPDERGPVDFYGGSSLVDGDDIGPEDLVPSARITAAQPMASTLSARRSVSGPAMLDLSKTVQAGIISSPVSSSIPSDSSTPSAGSFSSTTGSVDSTRQPLTPQSFATKRQEQQAAAKLIKVDLTGRPNLRGKLGKEVVSLTPSTATFTLDDLLPTADIHPSTYTPPASMRPPRVSSAAAKNKPPRIETEMHEPVAAPLPSPARTRAPKPVFADGFKLKPIERLRSESPTRKPPMVSPMSMPGMTAYFEDCDEESEPDLPAFIREEKARKASQEALEWEEGEAVLRSLGAVAKSPVVHEAPRHHSLAGLGVSAPEVPTPRRDTHPSYESSSESRRELRAKKASQVSLTALAVEPTPKEAKRKSREIAAGQRPANDGVVRLGAASKRGFDKSEITGWLHNAQKEIAVERATLAA